MLLLGASAHFLLFSMKTNKKRKDVIICMKKTKKVTRRKVTRKIIRKTVQKKVVKRKKVKRKTVKRVVRKKVVKQKVVRKKVSTTKKPTTKTKLALHHYHKHPHTKKAKSHAAKKWSVHKDTLWHVVVRKAHSKGHHPIELYKLVQQVDHPADVFKKR
jgi:hypothetical protein